MYLYSVLYDAFRIRAVPQSNSGWAGPHDLGSGETRGETFPELTVRPDAEPVSDDEDPGGRGDLTTNDTGPELDMVTRNLPYVRFFA